MGNLRPVGRDASQRRPQDLPARSCQLVDRRAQHGSFLRSLRRSTPALQVEGTRLYADFDRAVGTGIRAHDDSGGPFGNVNVFGALDQTWHHVAVTVSLEPNVVVRSYVDGVLQETASYIQTGIIGGGFPLFMGNDSNLTLRGHADALQLRVQLPACPRAQFGWNCEPFGLSILSE